MVKICLPSNHYFYSSTNDVHKICKPFFEQYQFTFFDYARHYKNSDFYGLSVNSDLFKLYFELEYETLAFLKNISFEYNKFYYFFSTGSHSDVNYSHALRNVFKITESDHGFIILKKQIDYIDIFYFSSPHPHHIAINNYLNQLPIITKFIYFFQNSASKLIFNVSENRIILPSKMVPKPWNSSTNESIDCNAHIYSKNIFALSKLECKILSYTINGKTARLVAEILNISRRTVESYLENIKIKLNVKSKSELIEKASIFYTLE